MADDKLPRQADDIPLQKWCNYGATPREIRREIRKAVRAAFPQTKILVKPVGIPIEIEWEDGPTVAEVQEALKTAVQTLALTRSNGQKYLQVNGYELDFDRFNRAEREAAREQRKRDIEQSYKAFFGHDPVDECAISPDEGQRSAGRGHRRRRGVFPYDLSTPELIEESARDFYWLYGEFHGAAAIKAFSEVLMALAEQAAVTEKPD